MAAKIQMMTSTHHASSATYLGDVIVFTRKYP